LLRWRWVLSLSWVVSPSWRPRCPERKTSTAAISSSRRMHKRCWTRTRATRTGLTPIRVPRTATTKRVATASPVRDYPIAVHPVVHRVVRRPRQRPRRRLAATRGSPANSNRHDERPRPSVSARDGDVLREGWNHAEDRGCLHKGPHPEGRRPRSASGVSGSRAAVVCGRRRCSSSAPACGVVLRRRAAWCACRVPCAVAWPSALGALSSASGPRLCSRPRAASGIGHGLFGMGH
jgi:hypothetical protein